MGKFGDRLLGVLYPPGTSRLDAKVATALFLILFSTQLTLTSPFSYLPAMVKNFGYKDQERGYYAGIIASSLFVGRFLGGYFWGWLTDRIGRKPVLLISASLTYLTTIAFGFTTSLWWAIVTRFMQGLVNGVIVVGRAAFAEICDDTNQAIGVALVFTAWNSAIVIGPAIGGYLADPVKKFPGSFKGVAKDFFTKYAFIMPNILIAGTLMISIVLIYFSFDETMKKPLDIPSSSESSPDEARKVVGLDDIAVDGKKEEGVDTDATYKAVLERETEADKHRRLIAEKSVEMDSVDGDRPDDKQLLLSPSRKHSSVCMTGCCAYIRTMSLYELVRDRTVVLVILMFGVSGFTIVGFTELSSLWMATGTAYGGLDFSTDNIGTALLVPALISVFLQPVMFSRMERKIGGILTLKYSLLFLGITTLVYPFMRLTLKMKYVLWPLLVLIGLIRMITDISSRSCLALFINNSVYSEQAGRVNGLAFSVQEIMRVAAPTMMGSLFAWSISEGYEEVGFPFDFHFSFFLVALFIFVLLVLCWLLPQRLNAPKLRTDSSL